MMEMLQLHGAGLVISAKDSGNSKIKINPVYFFEVEKP